MKKELDKLKEENAELKARLETENRRKEIDMILGGVSFKSEEIRLKIIETLTNCDLPLEVIRDTYEPLVGTKNKIISADFNDKVKKKESYIC